MERRGRRHAEAPVALALDLFELGPHAAQVVVDLGGRAFLVPAELGREDPRGGLGGLDADDFGGDFVAAADAIPGVTTEPVEGELAWQADALCAQTDPEAFFPEKGGSTRDAKRVCEACTVKDACLEYAKRDRRFGGAVDKFDS